MSEKNRQTIVDVYAAFGRGDVTFIAERVTPDTSWDFNVVAREVPWHAPVSSRGELPSFFRALGENVELEAFEPRLSVASEKEVVVRVHIAYRVKRTGRRVDQEQVHWWSFDEAGRIAKLRHFEDTALVRDAWLA